MRDYNGDHTTPKQLAEQILMDAISSKLEFIDESLETDHLTPAERAKVDDQAFKIAKRIASLLHFDPESFLWSNP
jgi:hypothetical protein